MKDLVVVWALMVFADLIARFLHDLISSWWNGRKDCMRHYKPLPAYTFTPGWDYELCRANAELQYRNSVHEVTRLRAAQKRGDNEV